MLTLPSFAPTPTIRHAFFTRQGGVSTGIYESLNIGLGSNDSREHVLENRRQAMAMIGRKLEDLYTVYQTHSKTVVTIGNDHTVDAIRAQEADALVTNVPGKVLGISTADCTPILFADPVAKVIGAAHAGWKGAIQNIMQETVLAMEALGAKRATIQAAIGPCIRQPSYEVGAEFYTQFMAESSANSQFFLAQDVDKYRFDMPGFVKHKLAALGLAAIHDIERDTYAEASLFFSFRRTTHRKEADYGRELSAIVLE